MKGKKVKRRRNYVEHILDVLVAPVDTPEVSRQDQSLQLTLEQIPDVLVRVVDLPVHVTDQDDLLLVFASFVEDVR